jgi:hypothetical protein
VSIGAVFGVPPVAGYFGSEDDVMEARHWKMVITFIEVWQGLKIDDNKPGNATSLDSPGAEGSAATFASYFKIATPHPLPFSPQSPGPKTQ